MKPSEILQAAKKHLWDGKTHSSNKASRICSAIDIAVPVHTLGASDSLRELNDHIHDLIGCASLKEWLIQKHGIDPYYSQIKLQATRFAWIDDMIDYFKSKGK